MIDGRVGFLIFDGNYLNGGIWFCDDGGDQASEECEFTLFNGPFSPRKVALPTISSRAPLYQQVSPMGYPKSDETMRSVVTMGDGEGENSGEVVEAVPS